MADESDTQSEILDAAYTVLVEQGYDGFTTRAVADEAGRNQSLVHYYFETKRDLLLALLEDGLETLESQVDQLATGGDPIDRLHTLTEFMIGPPDEEGIAFRRMLLELSAQAPYDEDVRAAIAYDDRRLKEYITDIVRDGIERGEFCEVDPESFAAAYLAALGGGQTNTAVFGEDADADLIVAGLHAIVEGYLVEREE